MTAFIINKSKYFLEFGVCEGDTREEGLRDELVLDPGQAVGVLDHLQSLPLTLQEENRPFTIMM